MANKSFLLGCLMLQSPKEALKESLSRIFRSQDLTTSNRILFSFFQQYFPLDFITLLTYSGEQHAVLNRVHITDTSVILVDDLIKFSEETKKDAQIIADALETFIYVPDGREHALVKQFDEAVGINQPASTIMQAAEMSPDRYVTLALVCWGANRYSENDIHLLNNFSGLITSAVRYIYSQLSNAQLRERLVLENKKWRRGGVQAIIGSSSGLKDVILSAEQVSKLDTPVLLIGETGTGKEVVANIIHRRSRHANSPLVSINCGAIAETLLDSELFGHEKGAFTGANMERKGFFEQANGGTIFLDEVTELSKQAQVKLLRVLQEMSFRRVGGQRTITIDLRVIAATNRDIAKMVENQEFRQDLWFRLNTFIIKIPPLRERKEDIPLLAEFFAERLARGLKLPYRYSFAPYAMEQLQRYDWPGNVRELENTIEQALIVSRGAPMSFPHLDLILPGPLTSSLIEEDGRNLTMREVMRNHIVKVLNSTKGRIHGKGGAAEILDMKPSTLRAKIVKLGIKISRVSHTE